MDEFLNELGGPNADADAPASAPAASGGDDFEVYHVGDEPAANAEEPDIAPPTPATNDSAPTATVDAHPPAATTATTDDRTAATAAAATAATASATAAALAAAIAGDTKTSIAPAPATAVVPAAAPVAAAAAPVTVAPPVRAAVNSQFDSVLQLLDQLQITVQTQSAERTGSDMVHEFQMKQSTASVQHAINTCWHEQTAMQNARHEKVHREQALKQRVAEENMKQTALNTQLSALRDRRAALTERAEHRKGFKKNPHFPFIIRPSKLGSLDKTLIKTHGSAAKSLALAQQKALMSTAGTSGGSLKNPLRRTVVSNGVTGGGWNDGVKQKQRIVTPTAGGSGSGNITAALTGMSPSPALANLQAYIQLPSTVIVHLFSYIGVRDVDSCSRVSHAWRTCLARTKVWKQAMNRVNGVQQRMKIWLAEQQKLTLSANGTRGGRSISSADVAPLVTSPTTVASAIASAGSGNAAGSNSNKLAVTTPAAATSATTATTHLHHTLTIEVTANDGYIVSVSAERVLNRDCELIAAGTTATGVMLSPAAHAAARAGDSKSGGTPASPEPAHKSHQLPSPHAHGGRPPTAEPAAAPVTPLLVPGTAGIDKKKKTVVVVICDIKHRAPVVPPGSNAAAAAASAGAGVLEKERVFCHALIEHHIALTQQKLEKARLLAQMDDDDAQKKAYKKELSLCMTLLQSIRSRTDDVKQQFQSDEITKQFLLEQLSDVQKRTLQAQSVHAASKAGIAKLLEEKKEELRALEDEERRRSSAAAAGGASGAAAALNEPILQLRSHRAVLAKELKTLQIAVDKARLELSDKQHEQQKVTAMARAAGIATAAGATAAAFNSV